MGEKISGFSQEDLDKRAQEDLEEQLVEQEMINDISFNAWYRANSPKPEDQNIYIEKPEEEKGEKNGN